jgi:hypothetical protein
VLQLGKKISGLKRNDFRCLVYTTQQKRAVYHIELAVSYIRFAESGKANLFIVTMKYHSVNLKERPLVEVKRCANKEEYFFFDPPEEVRGRK